MLFCYELFDLWALPRATAYLVLAYFASALTVDLIFSGANFCKYLCPIGQFNFVASTMSPLELRVKDVGTCHSCRTVDCIKGRRAPEAPAVVRTMKPAFRPGNTKMLAVTCSMTRRFPAGTGMKKLASFWPEKLAAASP